MKFVLLLVFTLLAVCFCNDTFEWDKREWQPATLKITEHDASCVMPDCDWQTELCAELWRAFDQCLEAEESSILSTIGTSNNIHVVTPDTITFSILTTNDAVESKSNITDASMQMQAQEAKIQEIVADLRELQRRYDALVAYVLNAAPNDQYKKLLE